MSAVDGVEVNITVSYEQRWLMVYIPDRASQFPTYAGAEAAANIRIKPDALRDVAENWNDVEFIRSLKDQMPTFFICPVSRISCLVCTCALPSPTLLLLLSFSYPTTSTSTQLVHPARLPRI